MNLKYNFDGNEFEYEINLNQQKFIVKKLLKEKATPKTDGELKVFNKLTTFLLEDCDYDLLDLICYYLEEEIIEYHRDDAYETYEYGLELSKDPYSQKDFI